MPRLGGIGARGKDSRGNSPAGHVREGDRMSDTITRYDAQRYAIERATRDSRPISVWRQYGERVMYYVRPDTGDNTPPGDRIFTAYPNGNIEIIE